MTGGEEGRESTALFVETESKLVGWAAAWINLTVFQILKNVSQEGEQMFKVPLALQQQLVVKCVVNILESFGIFLPENVKSKAGETSVEDASY